MIYIISFIVHFIIVMGIMIASFYIFKKSIQYKAPMSHIVLAVAWSLLWAALYEIAPLLIPLTLYRPLLCAATIIFAFFLSRRKLEKQRELKTPQILEIVVSAYLLSFGISLCLHYIAIVFIGPASMFFMRNNHIPGTPLDYNQPIYILIYALIAILQLISAFLLFRFRRLRKGFPFIFKRFTIVAALFFTGIVLILVTWVNITAKSEDVYTGYNLDVAGVLIAGVGIYILIRRLIKAYQSMRMEQNAIEYYKKLWLEEKENKEQAHETIKYDRSIINGFSDKIESIENNALGQGNFEILTDIQKLKNHFQNKLAILKEKQLPINNRTAQQNTSEEFEKLWLEEKEDREQVYEINAIQSSIIHNFADRVKAIENSALAQDNVTLLEDVQNLKKDLQGKLDKRKIKQLLPSTNNSSIDRLLQDFAKQFIDDNIDFKVIVNGSVNHMIESVVTQDELETLILNHLKDAQIAVNASDNINRSITAVIGAQKDCYLLTVWDSGIPFEVDILSRLGTGRVTNHADTGGSGIGFETTFETMREHKASLVINEQELSADDFSKSVSIRFDGKGQYIIETHRPGEFPASERYIVIGR